MKKTTKLLMILCTLCTICQSETYGQTIDIGPNQYAFRFTQNPNFGLFFNASAVQYEFRDGNALPIFAFGANNGRMRSNLQFDPGSDYLVAQNRYAFRSAGSPNVGLFASTDRIQFLNPAASPIFSINVSDGKFDTNLEFNSGKSLRVAPGSFAFRSVASPNAGIFLGNSNYDFLDASGNSVFSIDINNGNTAVQGSLSASGGTSAQWTEAYAWGDHADVGYLLAEGDPTFAASPAFGITVDDIDRWGEAYNWGNHAEFGYLQGETDPLFSASPAAGILLNDIQRWNVAFNWGNHATEGYLKKGNNTIIVDAAGNGDYTTISAALTAVNPTAQSPVVIKVMPGTYVESVTLKSHVSLEGSGAEVTRIKGVPFGGGIAAVMYLNGTTGVTVKDVLLTGSDGSFAEAAIYLNNGASANFENVVLKGDFDFGLEEIQNGIIAESANFTMFNSKMLDIQGRGIDLQMSSTATVSNSQFKINSLDTRVDLGSEVNIVGCTFEGTGIDVEQNCKASVSSSSFKDFFTAVSNKGEINFNGNRLEGGIGSFALVNNNKASVVGNTFLNCMGSAIIDVGPVHSTYTGNYIENCSSLGQYAMIISTPGSVVSGNKFFNNAVGDMSLPTSSSVKPWVVGNNGSVNNPSNVQAIMAGIDNMRLERAGNVMEAVLPEGGKFSIGSSSPSDLLSIQSADQENAMRVVVSNTTRFRIYGTGGVGVGSNMSSSPPPAGSLAVSAAGLSVGSSNPDGFQLRLSANAAAKPGSNTWTVISDKRLKDETGTFDDGLEVIRQIEPKRFVYNGKGDIHEKEECIGTMAQDLAEVAPYMVKTWLHTDTVSKMEETYLAVDYGAMDFLLVNAIKELDERTAAADPSRLAALEKALAEKDALIEAQQRQIDDILDRLSDVDQSMQSCCFGESKQGNTRTDSDAPELGLNVPNPFAESTVISYYLPASSKQAMIRVTAMDGRPVKDLTLGAQHGHNQVEFRTTGLAPGTYIYSLFVDAKFISSKRMMIAR